MEFHNKISLKRHQILEDPDYNNKPIDLCHHSDSGYNDTPLIRTLLLPRPDGVIIRALYRGSTVSKPLIDIKLTFLTKKKKLRKA